MNESWPQRGGINPHSIIDLRPQHVRRRAAWRDITALRIVVALVRLLWRAAVLLCQLSYQSVRALTRRRVQPTLPFNFVQKTVDRIDAGLRRELSTLKQKPVNEPQSLIFKIINFILVLCLIALPFIAYGAWRSLEPLRASITQSAKNAVSGLFSAKNLAEQQNFSEATTAFENAGANFLKAQSDLSSINKSLLSLAAIIPDEKFKFASESRHLLKAGQISARLGAQLSTIAKASPEATVLSFLDRFAAVAAPASEEARLLELELAKINPKNLPQDYRDEFIKLRSQANALAPNLEEAGALALQASSFLGKQMDKRYLLVFQNNAEKRGAGGFMGSFAVVDMSKGEIKNILVPKGGTYDTEAGLSEKIVAPEPLWLLNPLWHFWDSNWWPDWPKSARKIEWFYEKSNGPTVDGVISLTPTVMERLLTVTGPIDMTKDYGVVISSDNFWQVTQTFSEQKPNITKEPKKIIGDLMTKLMEELPKNLNPEKVFKLVAVLEQSLNEKQILLYLNDPDLEQSVVNFGWDGGIKKTDGDYLMVVSSNIGGQKSDRAIKETIEHNAQILPDGQIIVNLTVQRQHTALKNEIFVGVRNVNWLRVYVPEGSELLAANGFATPDQIYFENPDPAWKKDPDLQNETEAKTHAASGVTIYQEDGKTVFANWSMVDPGQTAVLRFRYRLPFKVTPRNQKDWLSKISSYFETDPSYRYSLLVQKQPGSLNTVLSSTLAISGSWETIWQYPNALQISDKGWTLNKELSTDIYATTLFHKK